MSTLVSKLRYRIRTLISRKIIMDNAGGQERSILIAGSARSGTTILSEAINSSYNYRLMFEPFVPEYVPEWKMEYTRMVLDERELYPEIKSFCDRLFTGKIKNSWVDHLNPAIKPEGRIIKAVRVNLMLPWIMKNYPELPVIFIWRSPKEVIESRLNLGWDDVLEEFKQQKEILQVLYPNWDFSNYNSDSIAERHCMMWCIENKWALENISAAGGLIISYKKLCSDPEGTAVMLNEKLSIQIDVEGFVKRMKRPSQSSSWRRRKPNLSLNQAEEIRIQEIIQGAGLNQLLS